jgi:hypothetical protein
MVFRLKLIREDPCKSVVDFAWCPRSRPSVGR